jgi:hypothetical protein
MRKKRLLLVIFAILAVPSLRAEISVSDSEAQNIARKVWQNECGGSISGLTSWNSGENFASLGIGHFIWYPAGQRGPFEESFPKFLRFAEQHGAQLPPQAADRADVSCPWRSRAEFLSDRSSPRMKMLREFLADTVNLQARFLVQRLQEAFPRILASVPSRDRSRIQDSFQSVASTAQGCYALIDYVNFKGEGLLETERYKGQGWGLLQVLEGMPEASNGTDARKKFADSAARVLRKRVENSPPERHEKQWLSGWLNRVATYR